MPSSIKHYIYECGSVAEVPLAEWCAWFETANRHVAHTKVGNVRISTIFLGLDFNVSPKGKPLLFETKVFGGEFGDLMRRYHTYAEAHAGHFEIQKRVIREHRRQSDFDPRITHLRAALGEIKNMKKYQKLLRIGRAKLKWQVADA